MLRSQRTTRCPCRQRPVLMVRSRMPRPAAHRPTSVAGRRRPDVVVLTASWRRPHALRCSPARTGTLRSCTPREIAGLRPSSYVAVALAIAGQVYRHGPAPCLRAQGEGRRSPTLTRHQDRQLLAELLRARLALRRYGVHVGQVAAGLHSGGAVPARARAGGGRCGSRRGPAQPRHAADASPHARTSRPAAPPRSRVAPAAASAPSTGGGHGRRWTLGGVANTTFDVGDLSERVGPARDVHVVRGERAATLAHDRQRSGSKGWDR